MQDDYFMMMCQLTRASYPATVVPAIGPVDELNLRTIQEHRPEEQGTDVDFFDVPDWLFEQQREG